MVPIEIGDITSAMPKINSNIRKPLSLFALLVCLTLSGCSHEGPDLGDVTGVVTKGGKPQAKLWIEFTPAAGGRAAEGRTDGEGRYKLTYTVRKSGAVVGANKVRISSGGEVDSRENQLSPRVELKTTPDTVDVKGGSNTFDFEVK
jgi:hypothetical protein